MISVSIHECSLNLLLALLLQTKYALRRKYVPAITDNDAITVPKDLMLCATIYNDNRLRMPELTNAQRITALILCFSVCT